MSVVLGLRELSGGKWRVCGRSNRLSVAGKESRSMIQEGSERIVGRKNCGNHRGSAVSSMSSDIVL